MLSPEPQISAENSAKVVEDSHNRSPSGNFFPPHRHLRQENYCTIPLCVFEIKVSSVHDGGTTLIASHTAYQSAPTTMMQPTVCFVCDSFLVYLWPATARTNSDYHNACSRSWQILLIVSPTTRYWPLRRI